MLSRGRAFVAPVYFFACIVLGGSAQGLWQNMVLQLAGVAIIAWAAMDAGQEPLAPGAKHLLTIAGLVIAVVMLQMVPLPPGVWEHLGPRGRIAEGFAA